MKSSKGKVLTDIPEGVAIHRNEDEVNIKFQKSVTFFQVRHIFMRLSRLIMKRSPMKLERTRSKL